MLSSAESLSEEWRTAETKQWELPKHLCQKAARHDACTATTTPAMNIKLLSFIQALFQIDQDRNQIRRLQGFHSFDRMLHEGACLYFGRFIQFLRFLHSHA